MYRRFGIETWLCEPLPNALASRRGSGCVSLSQVCNSGTCVCKEGFPACATRGGRCLDAQSCPAGSGGGSNAVDINTQDVGGTVGILG